LRAAVGNFPDHLEELMACANYVRFTQLCRRGSLRVGDLVDGSDIPLVSPKDASVRKSLSDYLGKTDRPLAIIASSYT